MRPTSSDELSRDQDRELYSFYGNEHRPGSTRGDLGAGAATAGTSMSKRPITKRSPNPIGARVKTRAANRGLNTTCVAYRRPRRAKR
jgi:hypothetical protein